MSHHEDSIDAVLHALRTAEPAAGFESRMQQALQTEAAPRRTFRLHWGCAAAVCLLLCGLVIGVRVQMRHVVRPVAVTKPLLLAPPAPQAIATVYVHERKSVARSHVDRPVRAAATAPQQEDVATTHQNIPPPPLPLTQEEKLVLRMMRRDDLPQLATLSGEARERGLRDDAQQYSAFFEPRPPLDGQPYFDQHISGGSQ